MLETLQEFHARVDGFQHDSLPGSGWLTTKPQLTEKVAADGALLPFFGNTMIYALPREVQLAIARMQLILHHRCGWMLADPLAPETLHLTLHDLLNGVNRQALEAAVISTGEQAREILARLRAGQRSPVQLTSTAAFNMVNGSVALGFAPDTEADCAEIMTLHACFQEVTALDYSLTPHVTLAYYKPGNYGPECVDALRGALREINALPPLALTLDAAALDHYRFVDMNTYIRD